MKNKIITFLLLCLMSFSASYAARVDTIQVPSKKMDKNVPTLVIVPEASQGLSAQAVPVLYLLHGYTGDETSWLGIKPNLPQLADAYGILIVCPDGENSWYFDSPVNPLSQFGTFTSSELVSYIDSNYKTIALPTKRAITGLSMGGHGALLNAIKHPEVFGAAGSMSGAVRILDRADSFNLLQLLGNQPDNFALWYENSVMEQVVDNLKDGVLELYIDCGVDDYLYEMNQNLHKALLEKKIKHDYTVRPGQHDADYWNNAVDYQILFFSKFFAKSK